MSAAAAPRTSACGRADLPHGSEGEHPEGVPSGRRLRSDAPRHAWIGESSLVGRTREVAGGGDPFGEAAIASILGAIEVARGAWTRAAELCDQALATDGRLPDPQLVALTTVVLAASRFAEDACDESVALVDALRGYAVLMDEHGDAVARVMLEAIATARGSHGAAEERRAGPRPAPKAELKIGPWGTWFRMRGGEQVGMGRRRAMRRLLVRLVEQHLRAPGSALTMGELIAAGWPDERMSASAAANRFHNSMAVLRRLGLREILQLTDEGYRIDPSISVVERRASGHAVDRRAGAGRER